MVGGSEYLHNPAKAEEFARALGLQVGGAGHPFVGNWQTKGLYAYCSGQYSGIAYFGSGGSENDRLAYLSESEKYRPWNRHDPNIPSHVREKLIALEEDGFLAETQTSSNQPTRTEPSRNPSDVGVTHCKPGPRLTYADSEVYAAKMEGRLLTLDEAKALMGGRALYPGEDQWCAVQGRDWVQVGDLYHHPGKSHNRECGGYPPWGDDANNSTYGNPSWNYVALYKAAGGTSPTPTTSLSSTGQRECIEILEAVPGKPVHFKLNNPPSSHDAWVGIYPTGASDQDHGEQNKRWKWLRDIDVNNASFRKQAEGDWSIRVFSDGGHTLHERKDFAVKWPDFKAQKLGHLTASSRKALVAGITLFIMGLPLLIIGSTSTSEDRLAMLIPGAVMFSIGAFVSIAALVTHFRILVAFSTRPSHKDPTTSSDNDWFAELTKKSEAILSQSSKQDNMSHHQRVSERMKYPKKKKVEFDISRGSSLQKWYVHLLRDPAKAKIIARELGLETGESGYGFEGKWRTKGLFAYKSGKYARQAYFGIGGTEKEQIEPVDGDEKYRPWNRKDPNMPKEILEKLIIIEPILARSYYLEPPNDV